MGKRDGRTTLGGAGSAGARGFPTADPDEPTLVGQYPTPVIDDPPTLDEPVGDVPDPRPEPPPAGHGIEVVQVPHDAPPLLPEGVRVALEVWTKNRIYALDAANVCREVRERDTSASTPGHPLLGALLVGGQRRERGLVELAHPFPRAGTEAVFEQAGKHGNRKLARTSRVDKVVIMQYLIRVAPDEVPGSWTRITRTLSVVGSGDES